MSDGLIWGLAVLGCVLAIFFVLAFRYPDVIRDFFYGIEEFDLSIKGFKIRRAVRAAGYAVEQKEHRKPDTKILRENLETIPSSTHVLWVDDTPENNLREIDALELIGVKVDTVRSNAEAESAVRRKDYSLIISDIGRRRPEPDNAGLLLPHRLADILPEVPPIVYYTGHAVSPRTPAGYPVTDVPSALFEAIQSALSRSEQSG